MGMMLIGFVAYAVVAFGVACRFLFWTGRKINLDEQIEEAKTFLVLGGPNVWSIPEVQDAWSFHVAMLASPAVDVALACICFFFAPSVLSTVFSVVGMVLSGIRAILVLLAVRHEPDSYLALNAFPVVFPSLIAQTIAFGWTPMYS